MSDCDVSAGGNFTDEDYVNHLNGKLEVSLGIAINRVSELEADNKVLTVKAIDQDFKNEELADKLSYQVSENVRLIKAGLRLEAELIEQVLED